MLPLEVVVLGLAVLTGHCRVTRLLEGAAGCEGRTWLGQPRGGQLAKRAPGATLQVPPLSPPTQAHPPPFPLLEPSSHGPLPLAKLSLLYPLPLPSPSLHCLPAMPRPPHPNTTHSPSTPSSGTAPPPLLNHTSKPSSTSTGDHDHCTFKASQQLMKAGHELSPFYRQGNQGPSLRSHSWSVTEAGLNQDPLMAGQCSVTCPSIFT